MPYNTNEETGKSDWKDIQIGICRALEWTLEEAGELVGLSSQAVLMRQRSGKHAKAIADAKSWTETAAAKYLAKKVREMETKADVKARIHSKAYRVVEKALDHGLKEPETIVTETGEIVEKPGVEVSAIHLKAADMGIERNEGKALDRKEILEMQGRVVVHQIDTSTLTAALAQMEKLNAMRQTAYLPPAPAAIEAEIIGEPAN